MGATGLICFLLIRGVLTYHQNEFTLIFERAEIVSFNTSFYGFAKTHNFKLNRTHAAIIFTGDLKVALGNEVKIEIQAYRLASNEYREFPVPFMFDYCEFCARNEFGMNTIFACGNSTGCPFKKGTYTSCTWAPNGEKFPPFIPAGSYMVDIKYFFRSVEFLFLQGFGTIKYPQCKGCPI